MPELRRRAPLPDRDRGRPHLQARHALLRAARRDASSTRTAARSRSSWAATGSARAGSWPRRSSSATTRTGSLAGGDRAVRRARGRAAAAPRSRPTEAARACSRRPAATCCSTTATCAPGEKFADADLIGAADARHRRQEDARGRHGRRARPAHAATRRAVKRRRHWARRPEMAKRRRFSAEPFGPTVERLMDEIGDDLPRARREDRPLGRLPEPPRPRQPAGAVERGRASGSPRRSASSRSTSASTACA